MELIKTINTLNGNTNYRITASLLVALVFVFGSDPAKSEDDLPAINSDPTKLQQLTEPLPRNTRTKDQGFELPVVPKQGELEQKGGSVEIQQVVFEGNTVFSDADLQAIVASFLNRKLKASDIESMRRLVTQFYIDHGYISSGAVLVSQSLASGVLKLSIVESSLSDVKQTGQERLPEYYIRDRLIVGSGTPLNVQDLQDSYRQLLADPLIQQLNGQLLPGAHPGESVLDLRVTRARPYQLYLGADDYQTSAVGAYTGRIGGWVDNLLTLGERIDAQFIVNEGSQGYNTGINVPVSARDTRVSFRYSDTYSTIVEAPVDKLHLTSQIIGYDAGISHPLYRSFADDLTLGLNFVVRQNRTKVSGNCIPLAGSGNGACDTQVSVLRMSQHMSHRGENANVVFWSTFNTGLDMLGATISQPGYQSGEFFSWLGQSLFSTRLLENGTSLVVKANIQLANTPLLNLERYSLGGVYTVRGYRENTYVRDNGFNTSVEIKYPLYGNESEQDRLHLVPFLDYGGAWNSSPNQPTDYLFSTGLGFNWQYKQLSTDFYWAHAFTPAQHPVKTSHSVQDDGIHFRVNLNVF